MFDLPGLASWHAYQYGSVAIIYAIFVRVYLKENGDKREKRVERTMRREDKETVDGVQ